MICQSNFYFGLKTCFPLPGVPDYFFFDLIRTVSSLPFRPQNQSLPTWISHVCDCSFCNWTPRESYPICYRSGERLPPRSRSPSSSAKLITQPHYCVLPEGCHFLFSYSPALDRCTLTRLHSTARRFIDDCHCYLNLNIGVIAVTWQVVEKSQNAAVNSEHKWLSKNYTSTKKATLFLH